MKVEIVSCSDANFWYSDNIGAIYEVEQHPHYNDFYRLIDLHCVIKKEDCGEVFEAVHRTKGKIEVIDYNNISYRIAGKAELIWKGYCQPIKKEKEMKQEFTKSDLKNFMRVKYRSGVVQIYIDGRFYDGTVCRGYIENYNENLICPLNSNADIVAVFEQPREPDLSIHRQGELIWERKEKSEQEIELEKLQEQIKALEKQAQKLKETLK